MQHFGIHIDWLSCHGVGAVTRTAFSRYRVENTGKSSANYKHVWDVVRLEDNAKVGILLTDPFSNIIDAHSVHFKIENRELWENPHFVQEIKNIFADLDLTFKGLSRVDYCCDFDEFANRLKPQTLIENFLAMKYRKFGRTHYNLHGDQLTHGQAFSYIAFGKRTSGVMTYLYNKSLEMRQVVSKPYITAAAKACGINTARDFWRLEISVNTNKVRIINSATGEVITPTLELLADKSFMRSTFFSLAYKYFRFHINNGARDIKDNPILFLFERNLWNDRQIVRIEQSTEQESNRSTKIFIKKLLLQEQELYALDAIEREALHQVQQSVQARYKRTFDYVEERLHANNELKDYTTKR